MVRVERENFSTGSLKKIKLILFSPAQTDTTEFDYSIHKRLNVEFKKIWAYCTLNKFHWCMLHRQQLMRLRIWL
jgi:hypothetical protein